MTVSFNSYFINKYNSFFFFFTFVQGKNGTKLDFYRSRPHKSLHVGKKKRQAIFGTWRPVSTCSELKEENKQPPNNPNQPNNTA